MKPQLRYGVTLILDEHGVALRGHVAVYALDVKLQDIDVTVDVLDEHAEAATRIALRAAGEWLRAEAASRHAQPPSAP
jgi:hypothetical protein